LLIAYDVADHAVTPLMCQLRPVPSSSPLAAAALAAGIKDIDAPIRWLAWRDKKLEAYEPGMTAIPPLLEVGCGDETVCHALVVCGSAMASVPIHAASLFVDVLYPAGCRTVVMSGGLGRGTLALWRELVERELTAPFGWPEPWDVGAQPESVHLSTQKRSKPVLSESDGVPDSLEERRTYCSEADVMMELFVEQCRARGLEVRFGGDPMAGGGHLPDDNESDIAGTPSEDAFIYLETASTNSGANCALSAQTLRALGFDMATVNVALVQHPQAHRRACLTWEKQMGWRPMGWCPAPTEENLSVSNAEMLLYALGEFRRIESYADQSKGFLVMPRDFPRDFVGQLSSLEPLLRSLIEDGLRGGGLTAYATSLGVCVL